MTLTAQVKILKNVKKIFFKNHDYGHANVKSNFRKEGQLKKLFNRNTTVLLMMGLIVLFIESDQLILPTPK